MEITVENKIELTRVQAQHRIQLRQGLRSQQSRNAKKTNQWSVISGRDVSFKVTSGSGSSSTSASGISSVHGKSILASQDAMSEESEVECAEKEIQELTSKLRALQKSNERALEDLTATQMRTLMEKDDESQKIMMVLILI